MIAQIINKVNVSLDNDGNGITTNYYSSEMNRLGLCCLYFNDVKKMFYLLIADKHYSSLEEIGKSRYVIITMGTTDIIITPLYTPETFIKLIERSNEHMHLLFEDNTDTPFFILLNPLAVKGSIHLLQNKKIYDIEIIYGNSVVNNKRVYFRCNQEYPFLLPYGIPINPEEFVRS